MDELKPCPCCGSGAFIWKVTRAESSVWTVCCESDECHMESWDFERQAAIDAWNRRKSRWISVSEKLPPLDLPVPIAEPDDKGQLHVDIAVRRPVHWEYYGDPEAMRDSPKPVMWYDVPDPPEVSDE